MSRGAKESIERTIPVLPVRDAVHFPVLVTSLHVVREPSLRAIRTAMGGDRRVFVSTQLDSRVEEPGAADLARFGTVSEILQALPMPDGGTRVVLRGLYRAKAGRIASRGGQFRATYSLIEDTVEGEALEIEAAMRAALETFEIVVRLNKAIPAETLQTVAHSPSPGAMADAIAHHLPIRPDQKQALLEELLPLTRLRSAIELLKREEQIQTLGAQIQEQVEQELGESQREFYLRQQLKIIQERLSEQEDRLGEAEDYLRRINEAGMPEEAHAKAIAEAKRLDRAPLTSPEGVVMRNYLDLLVELPWAKTASERLELAEAKETLERDHFGLEKVKERILDGLAVRKLRPSAKGPILCFVGPPGVGKTSVAQSIAAATGRPFARIALGGVRDEAELRGHRRTYVGAMPGRLIAAIRHCGAKNPVIALDEIDKVGRDHRGDPMSALLEALDPEQNREFVDHYVDAPFDLSEAMFIATANLLDGIPSALRDRMEILPFPSYTEEERIQIARRYLVPKALEEHGLSASCVRFSDGAIESLARNFSREAGVRGLQREIAAVCRRLARRFAEGELTEFCVAEEGLEPLIGRPKFARTAGDLRDQIGAVTGLVVSESGGDVVRIEASLLPAMGEQPSLRLTGNLGDVMKESAEAALTLARAHLAKQGKEFRFDAHVHVPEGGIPKDGPSAGLAIAIALTSAALGRPAKGDVAMTGEITLHGRVLPVGGVRDKALAARRHGYSTLILPAESAPDLDEAPKGALAPMAIVAVSSVEEALERALV